MRAHVRCPWVEAEVVCPPGEVLAVTGPNGAGKSVLLKALAGVIPSSTSVELAGREVGQLPPYRRDVGWVPQQPSLLAHLDARDNAAYALRARGQRRSVARDHAQAWLTRLGVGHLGSLRPHALSGGQVARVALARALVHQPALLLLDEALAALDGATRDEVRLTLREALHGSATATLMVTHDPADVDVLAHRVLRLREGRAEAGADTTLDP
ncbi:MAG TPA: ATP-binding cassette domain-containing protein [Mycobacteriales bacterium]|nr:ATP-binding cassette domain-containing protein [Mycobacteriales bacterium]